MRNKRFSAILALSFSTAVVGCNGKQGEQGAEGPQGPAGLDGSNGATGATGGSGGGGVGAPLFSDVIGPLLSSSATGPSACVQYSTLDPVFLNLVAPTTVDTTGQDVYTNVVLANCLSPIFYQYRQNAYSCRLFPSTNTNCTWPSTLTCTLTLEFPTSNAAIPLCTVSVTTNGNNKDGPGCPSLSDDLSTFHVLCNRIE